MIGYKAEERGCMVVAVDPQHTSQACSWCGHTTHNNRRSRDLSECRTRAYNLHVDLNGVATSRPSTVLVEAVSPLMDCLSTGPARPARPACLASPTGLTDSIHSALRRLRIIEARGPIDASLGAHHDARRVSRLISPTLDLPHDRSLAVQPFWSWRSSRLRPSSTTGYTFLRTCTSLLLPQHPRLGGAPSGL